MKNLRLKITYLLVLYIFQLVYPFSFSIARNTRKPLQVSSIISVPSIDKSNEYRIKSKSKFYELFTNFQGEITLPMQNPANLLEVSGVHNRVFIFPFAKGKVIHFKGIGMKKFPVQHKYDLELIEELVGNNRTPSEALDEALINGGLITKEGNIIPLEKLEKAGISCFTYYPDEELPQQLWGGARKSVIKETIETISDIKQAYQQAKSQNDPFIKYLNKKYNINRLSLMNPVGVFKPKEIPFYVKQPQKFINQYSDKLTASEKIEIKNNGKRVYKLKNGLDIADIPQEIQEDYIVFAYSLPTGERISELKNNPIDKVNFKNSNIRASHIKIWKNVFNYFGYSINFDFSNQNEKRQGITVKKESKRVPLRKASEEIIERAVINLSLSIYITHEVMGKSLGRLHESGQYFGPFETGNVDASGWIADIIALRRKENRSLDISVVKDSIREYCKALGILEERQKYIQLFEDLLEKSKKM